MAHAPTSRPGTTPWPAFFVLACAVAAHLALFLPVPLRYSAAAVYDETLFLQLAQHLVAGQWLGPYEVRTLSKGAGFPLWLAAVHGLGVPLRWAACATYIAACLLAWRALAPLLPPWPRVLAAAALLLCPAALGDFAVLRELIYPALTLAAVAATLGLLLRMTQGQGQPLRWCAWAVLSGLAWAAVQLTREEGLWLAPLLLAAAGAVLWRVWQQPTWRWPVALGVPLWLAAALGPAAWVSQHNVANYGVASRVETSAAPFTSALAALASVAVEGPVPPHVPVPAAAWPLAAAASPAFAPLAECLQGEHGQRWRGPGIRMAGPLVQADQSVREWLASYLGLPIPAEAGTAWLQQQWAHDPLFKQRITRFLGGPEAAQAFFSSAMDQEIGAAWFSWVLRDCAARAGHHADARKAQALYANITRELQAACASGSLRCNASFPLSIALRPQHVQAMPELVLSTTLALLRLDVHSTSVRLGHLGPAADLQAAESFLNTRFAPASARVSVSQPLETWISIWRAAMPWLAVAALLAWSAATLRLNRTHFALWAVVTLLLALVASRVALVTVLHAAALPGAYAVRFLAPAQPLLALLVVLAACLGWEVCKQWRRRGAYPLQPPR